MKLSGADYAGLERSWITKEIADAAGVFRAAHAEAKDLLVRRNGGGDLSGMVFPYYWPGDQHVLMHRVRLDTPLPKPDGKPMKYACAGGQRQHLYFPHCPPALLTDTSKPLIITEGEKKCLALWRMSLEKGMTFLPVAVGGVWNWQGVTGAETDEKGSRYRVRSPLPDLDRIAWKGRKVIILYDANAATNEDVWWARRKLASELMHRGARVLIASLPVEEGINGCDDYLYRHGPGKLDEVLEQALPYDWRAELQRTKGGDIRATFANALTALRYAPEWVGVLEWDEFAMRVTAHRAAPWGAVKSSWTDQEDRLTCEWLQRNGILIKPHDAGAAVQTVAHDQPYHPVRRYFESLGWDGTYRAGTWLSRYLGTQRNKYTDAVGLKWLVSVVARIMEPGCKADQALIVEGPQGIFKSTVFAVLGGEWYTDDVADLQSKDAPLGTRGKMIIEFSELDVVSKADKSRVKAFLSRSTDHFRMPYEKRAGDYPRECVFAGTTNTEQWMQDETGGRRFWPVRAGTIDIDALKRDRDQLWAEAYRLYYDGVPWWMESAELVSLAEEEQAQRYDSDPWEAEVLKWCASPVRRYHRERPGDPETPVEPYTSEPGDIVIEEVLLHCIGKPIDRHDQRDKNRISRILRSCGWERGWKREGDSTQRRWRKPCLRSSPQKSAKAGQV